MAIVDHLCLVYSYTTRNNRSQRQFNALDFNLNYSIDPTSTERRVLSDARIMPFAIHHTDNAAYALYHSTQANHTAVVARNLEARSDVTTKRVFRWPSRFVAASDDGTKAYALHRDRGEFDSDNRGNETLYRLRETDLTAAFQRSSPTALDIIGFFAGFARNLQHENLRRTEIQNFRQTSYNATRIFPGDSNVMLWMFDYFGNTPMGYLTGNTRFASTPGTFTGSGGSTGQGLFDYPQGAFYNRYPIRPNSSGSLSFAADTGYGQTWYQVAGQNNDIYEKIELFGIDNRAGSIVANEPFPGFSRNNIKLQAADLVVFAMAEGGRKIKRWIQIGGREWFEIERDVNHGPGTTLVDFKVFRGRPVTFDPPTTPIQEGDVEEGGGVILEDDDDDDDTPPVRPPTVVVSPVTPVPTSPAGPTWQVPAMSDTERNFDRRLNFTLLLPSSVQVVNRVYVRRRLYDTSGDGNHGSWQYLGGTPGGDSGSIISEFWSGSANGLSNSTTTGGPYHTNDPGRIRVLYISMQNWYESVGETYEFEVQFSGVSMTLNTAVVSRWSLPTRVKAIDPAPALASIVEPPQSTPPTKRTPASPLLIRWTGAEGTLESIRIQRRVQGSSTVYEYYDGSSVIETDTGTSSPYALGAHVSSGGRLSLVSNYDISDYPNATSQDAYNPRNNVFIPFWIDFSTYSPPSQSGLSNLQNVIANAAQPRRSSSYLIPVTHSSYSILWDAGGLRYDGWGLDGNIYEFRMRYKPVGQVWSDWTFWRAVECELPVPDPPTIISPDGSIELDPRVGEVFVIEIPDGTTATSVQLKRRRAGVEEYWSGDDVIEARGWSGSSGASSIPASFYTGRQGSVPLDPNWQQPGQTWSYSASYTTELFPEFSLIGYGGERRISTLSAEDLKPPAPDLIEPRNGVEIPGENAVVFKIRLPVGTSADNFRLRRHEQINAVSTPSEELARSDYEYWAGSILHVLWSSDDESLATLDGEFDDTQEHEITLPSGWQDAGTTYLYSVAYISRGLESSYSEAVSVPTSNDHPAERPTINAPDTGTIHSPNEPLTITIDPHGIPVTGVHIRRRANSFSDYRWRNNSNSDWQSFQPRIPLTASSTDGSPFDVSLAREWDEDSGDALKRNRWSFEVSFVDDRNVQSFWSEPSTFHVQSPSNTGGLVLYRTNTSTSYQSMDYDGNNVPISVDAQFVYQVRGYPHIIYGNEAFYLLPNSSVIAQDLSTRTIRIIEAKDESADVMRGLTANEANTHAYAIERFGSQNLRLVEWELPNFTNRNAISSGQRHLAQNSFFNTSLETVSPNRRILAVTDSYAYFMWWAIPLTGPSTMFVNYSSFTMVSEATGPGKSFAAIDDHRIYNVDGTTDIHRVANDADANSSSATRIIDDAFNAGDVTQDLWIEATPWHVWAEERETDSSNATQILEGRIIKRFDLPSGGNPTSMTTNGEVESFRVYRPTTFTYTPPPSPDAAPTITSPTEREEFAPSEGLIFEIDTPVDHDGIVIQRREEGTTAWFGWDIDELGAASWTPGSEPVLAYNFTRHRFQPSDPNDAYAITGNQWFGEVGKNYEFRIRFRNTSTRLLSGWSSNRLILCRAGEFGAPAPRITAPSVSVYPDGDVTFVIEIDDLSLLRSLSWYLLREEEGTGVFEHWDPQNVRWSTSGRIFRNTNRAMDGDAMFLRVEGTIPAEHRQPPNTTYNYFAYVSSALLNPPSSPYSAPLTMTSGTSLGEGITLPTIAPVELNDKTPHAPTWDYQEIRDQSSALGLTGLHIAYPNNRANILSWNFNARYGGQSQSAFQIRRQRADGSSVRYRTSSNTWATSPFTFTSNDTSHTLNPPWQAANDSLFYFVRVFDEAGRSSTWSQPLEIETRTSLAPQTLRITSPSVNQTVGQLPVMTWEVEDQVSYNLYVRLFSGGSYTNIRWNGQEQFSSDRRGTLYVPNNLSSSQVGLFVVVRDSIGRVTPEMGVLTNASFTPRAVPAVNVTPTTAAAVILGLENASDAVGVTRCVIERRIEQSFNNKAAARAAGASEEEIDNTVVVFELDHAPVSADATAVEDYGVRFDIDYQYRFMFDWDSDETRVITGWEG